MQSQNGISTFVYASDQAKSKRVSDLRPRVKDKDKHKKYDSRDHDGKTIAKDKDKKRDTTSNDNQQHTIAIQQQQQ